MTEADGEPSDPQPPAPDPEVAGPPVDPVEHALAVALLLIGLWLVGQKLIPSPDLTPATPDDSIPKLIAQWEAGGARGIVTCLVLVGLGSLTCCALFLPRALRDLRAALARRSLGHPTLGVALLLFGGWTICQIPPQLAKDGMALSVERGFPAATRVALRKPLELRLHDDQAYLAPDPDRPAPEGAVARARLVPGGLALKLSVTAEATPPLRLNGEVLTGGAHREVWPGDRLEAGPFAATIEGPNLTAVLVWSSLAGLLAIVGLLLMVRALELHRRRTEPDGAPAANLFVRLGLRREGLGREVARGAAGYLAFLPVYFLLLWLTSVVAQALGLTADSHPLVRALERDSGPALAAVIVVQAFLIAPVTEELIYRGVGQPAFERSLGAGGAVLATALLFAVVHPGFASLLPMFGLGVLFASLRLLSPTGSLVAPITAHAMHNGLTLALVLAIQRAGP